MKVIIKYKDGSEEISVAPDPKQYTSSSEVREALEKGRTAEFVMKGSKDGVPILYEI